MKAELRFGLWGIAIAMVAALGFAGCGGDDDQPEDVVLVRVRPDAPFATYSTFAIVSSDALPDLPDLPGLPEVPDDLPDDIRNGLMATEDAVRDQMTMIGLREVGVDGDPDLFVLDYAATQEEDAIVWQCVPGWAWWGWYVYWDPCAWMQPVLVEFEVGSILVLLADPDIAPDDDYGNYVFGGLGQGVLNGGNAEARIDSAVARMFDEYPQDE